MVADRIQANYLASEGIEVMKNLMDANVIQKRPWNQSFTEDRCYEIDYRTTGLDSNSSVDCSGQGAQPILFDPATGIYGYEGGGPSKFSRVVHVIPISSNEVKINSSVKWESRGAASEIKLEDYFFNWRP